MTIFEKNPKTGKPPDREYLLERFWSNVKEHKDPPCLQWTGSILTSGYGLVRIKGQKNPMLAHRLIWELKRGPIPEGFVLSHTCNNRGCVQIKHLQMSTLKVLGAQRGGKQDIRTWEKMPRTLYPDVTLSKGVTVDSSGLIVPAHKADLTPSLDQALTQVARDQQAQRAALEDAVQAVASLEGLVRELKEAFSRPESPPQRAEPGPASKPEPKPEPRPPPEPVELPLCQVFLQEFPGALKPSENAEEVLAKVFTQAAARKSPSYFLDVLQQFRRSGPKSPSPVTFLDFAQKCMNPY